MAERTRHRTAKWFGVIAVCTLIALFVVSVASSRWIGQEVISFIDGIADKGWYGQLVFLSVFIIVCLTGLIPASMLAMAAGTMYGFETGALLSSVGLSIGGILGFLASRSLFHDVAKPWVSSRMSLQKIDANIARRGWKVVALLRLSPVAPFGITSYALGLTRLRFTDYLVGTTGSLPAMVAYVYMGVLARAALDASSGVLIPWIRLGVMGLGVVATIVAAVHFYRIVNDVGGHE
jgi:uncharacterized membrane protein YdjX (TVP38/TMEM64 family)